MDFTDKVVIVTGASSGLGAASAVLFARHGAKLTLVGRNVERLEEVANKCEDARGNKPLSLRLNLTDRNACATIVAKTVATFGKINVLINCAGKLVMSSLFDDNIDVWDEIINLNLRVPYKLTHLALPYLIRTKGNVVNIIAANYARVRHGFIPFSVAKAALIRFTLSAAVEVSTEGVRINSVQSGVTRTKFFQKMMLDGEEEIVSDHNLPNNYMKIVEPEEVAKMVVFVASDVCPSVNGAMVDVHGASVLG